MWYIDDMKRHGNMHALTVFIFILMAASCTHQTEQYSVVDETASVRYVVKKAMNSVMWTEPVEPDALSAEPEGKINGTLFYPAAGFAVSNGDSSVFPMLEEFGSLDVSRMSKPVLTGVNDFLKQFSQKTLSFSSSYFDRPYEGVVILYESSRLPAITGWTIGKPFISTDVSASYEIPVLLATEQGGCKVRIFLNPEKAAADEVKVQQVMFGAVKSE